MKYRLITEWHEGKEYASAIYRVRERSRLGPMVLYCVGVELQAAQQICERMNTDPTYEDVILSLADDEI